MIEDDTKEEIHERLLRQCVLSLFSLLSQLSIDICARGIEHNRRIETMQRQHQEEVLREMQEQKVQVLPRSMEILETSMHQNIEEIFKLLVANQMVCMSTLYM